MKVVYRLMTGSIITGILSIIVSQLLLSAQVSVLQENLETLDITSATALIVYSVILSMFAFQFIITLMQAKRARVEALSEILIGSFLITLVVLGAVGYIFILMRSHLLVGVGYSTRLMKYFTYPAIMAIIIGDVQTIWILYMAVFLAVYNSANLYIIGV